jgi:hypothetical protein
MNLRVRSENLATKRLKYENLQPLSARKRPIGETLEMTAKKLNL